MASISTAAAATTATVSIGSTTKPDALELHELLTIVLTSSPAKCHPSTEMVEIVLDSLQTIGADKCRTIVMCDGYKRGTKHRPSRGIIDAESATRYDEYIARLRQASNAPSLSPSASALARIEVVVQNVSFTYDKECRVEYSCSTLSVMYSWHMTDRFLPIPSSFPSSFFFYAHSGTSWLWLCSQACCL